MRDLNELAKEIHQQNAKWWKNLETGEPIQRNRFECLALIISELCECLEAERKTKIPRCVFCDHSLTRFVPFWRHWVCESCQKQFCGPDMRTAWKMDDKLPHRRMAEVELADAYIRILDYCGGFNVTIQILDYPEINIENKGAFLFEIMHQIHRHSDGFDSLGFALWLIEEYSKTFGYHLEIAMEEKLEYNKTRADHAEEARRAQGGKLF